MYKIYFIEEDENESNEEYLGLVESEYISDAYMFIADHLHDNGASNCFLIPEADTDNCSLVYVNILTIPDYFIIEKLLN